MDSYDHVRRYPLNVVLAALGFETFKYRKAGTEGYGACPIHGSKKNTTCFSFDDNGRFNCFSCSAKGKGAIDAVMAIKQVGFREAVELLWAVVPAIGLVVLLTFTWRAVQATNGGATTDATTGAQHTEVAAP